MTGLLYQGALTGDGGGLRISWSHGANRYTVTFKKGEPPVNVFFSLTLYDDQHVFATNEIERYSIGTKNKNLSVNTDGSVTFYVQPDAPAERTNWLPSPKNADFSLFTRAYWPTAEVIDGVWTPRAIEKQKS